MRKIALCAPAFAIALILPVCVFGKTPPQPKGTGTLVIVFRDGHRQTFNLSEIERVEFPSATETATQTNPEWPSRGRFVGRWVVGDGAGNTFIITLKDDGNAERSLHQIHGTWVWVNGEARVTWDDGAQDAIRKVGSKFQKYAYHAGKSFTDEPDNVTAAENTSPKPI